MESNRRERSYLLTHVAKTKFNVQVRGGTVVSIVRDIIVIIGTDHLLYRIDLQSQKEFAKVPLHEGETVWMYCVPERFRVLTILKQSDQCDCPGDVDTVVELE